MIRHRLCTELIKEYLMDSSDYRELSVHHYPMPMSQLALLLPMDLDAEPQRAIFRNHAGIDLLRIKRHQNSIHYWNPYSPTPQRLLLTQTWTLEARKAAKSVYITQKQPDLNASNVKCSHSRDHSTLADNQGSTQNIIHKRTLIAK